MEKPLLEPVRADDENDDEYENAPRSGVVVVTTGVVGKEEAGEEVGDLAHDAAAGTTTTKHDLRVTCVRGWVLFLYCVLAICQAGTWNAFSPIYPAVYLAFPSWTPSYLFWVINTANISFTALLFPTPYFISKFGPRVVTIASAVFVFVAAGIRALPLEDGVPMQVIMIVSMTLNGLSLIHI